MKALQILLLVVPLCAAQFRIQGPSDGNRRAQGLQYDNEKGIQYDDQKDSLGTGDFTIQGASDGNSNFKIQGASDGNSDFQIHGATDGNANFLIRGPTTGNAQYHIQGATDGNANFQIRGATDGHSQSSIQGPYDANQAAYDQGAYDGGQGSALSYRDSSGARVNWKSYQHAARQQPQEQYQEPVHYAPAPAPAPAPRRKAARQQQYAQPVHQARVPEGNTPGNYKVFSHTPPAIQQLLQYQQQIPYENAIPQPFRYDFHGQPPAALVGPQEPGARVTGPQDPGTHVSGPQILAQQEQPTRAQYRGRPRGHSRQRRQAQRHSARQQKRPVPQRVPAEERIHVSTSIPSRIQDLLDFQAQIPYVNHIPEQWRYEKLLEQEKNLPPPQYERQPAPEPLRHSQRVRQRRAAQQQPPAHYNPNLPAQLQELLKFQASTPYHSVIPEQFRYEKLLAAQQNQHRQKRQTPRYQHNQQPSQQADLSRYARVTQAQAPAQPSPQYSTNLPGSIQQLLQLQASVPYEIYPNKVQYRLPDKPYVPQPVQPVAQPAPISQVPQQRNYPSPRGSPAQRPVYQPILAQEPQQPQAPQYQAPQYQQAPQPQYQPAPQPQYQQPQQPLYQPAPSAQPQYQAPQSPLYRPTAVQQPQPAQRPIYQPPQGLYQNAPQSQLLRPQYHPNQLPTYDRQSSYPQPNPVRPVTENQY